MKLYLPLKKYSALGLVVALLSTQSLFAYQPEKSFWAERRQATRRNPSAVLASLPLGSRGGESLAAQFPSPQILRSSLTQSVARSVPETFLKGHADLLAALSPAHGSVRRVSLGKNADPRGPIVVHIQDVHMNAEAQRNIRDTVAGLLTSGQVGLVALEGSTEDIALQPFVDFPNRKAVELTANYLLKENKISGPIHAAMTAQGKLPRILGIDDPSHYQANVQAYKDSAPKLEEAHFTIIKRRGELEVQKKAVFSPALLALDQTVNGYRNGKVSLGDYVETLSKIKSPLPPFKKGGQGGFAVVEIFLQALKTERKLDFKQVEAERSRLIEKLTQSLTPQEINELMAQSLAYRTGELRYGDFYAQLKEKTCQKKGIRLSDYPAMDDYIRYVLLADGIDAEQLLNEISSMEKTAYDNVAQTLEEKQLVAQSRHAWLTSKLADFSLTPPEWGEYKTFTKTKNPELTSFESFYREAESRDTAMAKNLLTALCLKSKSDPASPPIALLVTGGFHANGMAKQLTEQGATVISYVPKIEKVDTSRGSAYLSVFTQEKTPLEKLFQGEKLFLAQDPWTLSGQSQATAGIIGIEEIFAPGPRPREIEELESTQLAPGEVFEAVDTTLNTADVSRNGDPVAQVTLNSGVMSMSDQKSLSIGNSIFRKIVELGDPLKAFKQFPEFNHSIERFSRLFAEYVVNHFGNEVSDNRLEIPFAKKIGEEGVDKIDLFQRLEPHLTKKGKDYLHQLLDARERGDKIRLLSLQGDYPTKSRPRLELFTPLDEAMWIQWSRSGGRIAAIRLSEGCSRGCEHCYFNPSKRVVVLPYFRLLQILNRMKTSKKADNQFASVITLHEDNEIFDYYDPVFEADVADVVFSMRREFPNQSIGITTRGWYQGDRVAPQAAKRLANLRRQDPSAINLIYSLDLFDRMGNVTRMFARNLVNLDLLAGGNGSTESARIFLQPTHDQGSEFGVRRLISWTRFMARANLFLIAPMMETSPISISKGRGKKLQSSSGHPVDSCIWGLHIFPSGRAARKTESKETYEYLVQPRPIKKIPIPQWSESVSLWTGGLDVTDLIPKKISSREDPFKDIFPRRSAPIAESGKKGTGWIGVGVAWGWGMALGTWKKIRGRLEQGKSIHSFARDSVSHEGGRRAERAEDVVNGLVSVFVGLVAGQKGEVLSWLSLGTLSPPLAIVFPFVFVIGVWLVLFVLSHLIVPKKLETITGKKPSVIKSIRLFGFYLVPLIVSALLGGALQDLWIPVIFVALSAFQFWIFSMVRARHQSVNLTGHNADASPNDSSIEKPSFTKWEIISPFTGPLFMFFSYVRFMDTDTKMSWAYEIFYFPGFESINNGYINDLISLPTVWALFFTVASVFNILFKPQKSSWPHFSVHKVRTFLFDTMSTVAPFQPGNPGKSFKFKKTTNKSTFLFFGDDSKRKEGSQKRNQSPLVGLIAQLFNWDALKLNNGKDAIRSPSADRSRIWGIVLKVGIVTIVLGSVVFVWSLASPWVEFLFFEVPMIGAQSSIVLGAAGFLQGFVAPTPKQAGEQAAWTLVAHTANGQDALESVIPVIQNDHTGSIVGVGSSSADSFSTILVRLKNDGEFRAGFVGAIQTAREQGNLSTSQMNLLSVLVKGATGQQIAVFHILGITPQKELETFEALMARVVPSEEGGFSQALVVPAGQAVDVKARIEALRAKGVQVFEVTLGAERWDGDTLRTLERQMSRWLDQTNGIVATVGTKVGINPNDIDALQKESKLREALKNAVTLGETIHIFLRYLQLLASNA